MRLLEEGDRRAPNSATGHLGFLKSVGMCGFVRGSEWNWSPRLSSRNEAQFVNLYFNCRELQVPDCRDPVRRVPREGVQLNRDRKTNPTDLISAPVIHRLRSPNLLFFSGLLFFARIHLEKTALNEPRVASWLGAAYFIYFFGFCKLNQIFISSYKTNKT